MRPTAQTNQENGGRPQLKALPLILLVYFALAFYRLDHQSLWVDEVFSVQYAFIDGSLFSPAIWLRGHGPLYFALLHVWAQLGTSEFFLRTLSVVFGAGAVGLMYALGLRLYNRKVALIGATLLATSPFLIWYSQEVRYNALMIMTALLAMYTFLLALSEDRPWRWVIYGASILLAIAAFVSNILLPVMQGLYVLGARSHRPLLRKWMVCQGLLFVVFLWWANGGAVQHLDGYCLRLYNEITVNDKQDLKRSSERLASGGRREITPAVLPYTVFTFSAGYSLGPSVRELQVSRSFSTVLPYLPTLLILGGVFGGLCSLGIRALWRSPESGLLLFLWVGVSLIGVYGVSSLTGMAYNARYAAMALPAYLLVLAIGIASLRPPVAWMSALALVLSVNGVSLAQYYFDPRYGREDARAAIQYLESVYQPGDAILYVGDRIALRYYNRKNLPLMGFAKAEINQWTTVPARLHQLRKDHARLWFVTIRPWQVDPQGKIKAALDQLYTVSQEPHFAGVEIYCYQMEKLLIQG